ncbi:MAG: thiamine pyrophosphate-dependent enzyme [bacterium]|nr:thiamine pyrophosphate-dependent enzyme [bacterium]
MQKYDIETAKEVLRIRLSQMIVNEKYKEGVFKIPIHLAMGHEAIAVAVSSVMQGNDQLLVSHRNIHYNLAKTKALKPELNEYLLRDDGLANGQLGSMNLANEEKNIVYASSILGNNLPVASGLALAKKVKKEKSVVIVETGDGAIEEGAFYESLLFMKSNNLSVLIIVENNGWSLATKIKERRCNINLIKIAEAMDVKYEKLSSNNVYEYIEKLKSLKEYSLENKMPVIVEVELTTLGGWYLKTPENPKGRFINYHAGPAPEINLENGPEIESSENDPVFVLTKLFEKDVFQKMANEILQELTQEIER